MAQKPEVSLSLGIATAALVYGIYGRALPNLADVRAAVEQNDDIMAAERNAAWTSTAMVAAVSLIARDGTIFILGGTMIIAMSWWNRHANEVVPVFGKAVPDFFGHHDEAAGAMEQAQDSGGYESYAA